MSGTVNPDEWQLYTATYGDLAHMTRDQAVRHFQEYGRKEGRIWNDRRAFFARKYLKGKGIEIGALHNPLNVGPEAKVQYVDVRPLEELAKHYPELASGSYKVDIVDDGEKLTTFASGSLDFIIGNHFLEHTEDFIGTIENHVSKLRKGGVAYYAVPEKEYTFDKDREMTTWADMLADHADGGANSRERHYREWVTLVDKRPTEEVEARVSALMKMSYSIHFSVASHARWCELFTAVQKHLGNPFRFLELCENPNCHETIAILQKL
jgi:hypothetical protein